jgi:broad specificity phosphatase PhoE
MKIPTTIKPKLLNEIIGMKIIVTTSVILILSASQFGCTSKQSSENANNEHKPLVAFLVRHAEKADLSEDPELSDSGKERALELIKILRSANIEYVHSSDFIRTRETAAPTAEKFGLTIEIYDPSDLETLAGKLRDKGGNHLVVGHSGSTPQMAGLLGGDPVSEINEAVEYDRLYIVTISGGGSVNSIMMRYGDPYLERVE